MSLNLLVQKLPQTDKFGHAIRTDFRYWINYHLILEDKALDEISRHVMSLQQVYPDYTPERHNEFSEGASEFVNGWVPPRPNAPTIKISQEKLMDWTFDANDIIASFQQQYQIRLLSTALHWYEFIILLYSLAENTPMGYKMTYRGLVIPPEAHKDEKKRLQKIKASVRIGIRDGSEKELSNEEIMRLAEERAAKIRAERAK